MTTLYEQRWLEAGSQRRRIYNAMARRAQRRAAAAHPATGGLEVLVCNWGNEAAREVWRQHHLMWNRVFRASDAKVAAALHDIRVSQGRAS